MEFNPDKCEVLKIHRKKKPVIFPYTLHDTPSDNAKFAHRIEMVQRSATRYVQKTME